MTVHRFIPVILGLLTVTGAGLLVRDLDSGAIAQAPPAQVTPPAKAVAAAKADAEPASFSAAATRSSAAATIVPAQPPPPRTRAPETRSVTPICL